MRVRPESDADPDPDPEDPEREAVPRNSPSNAGGAPATSRRDTVAPMPLNLSSSQSDICSSPSPSAEMLGKEQASFRVSTKRLPLVSTNCRILACSVIGSLSAGLAKKPQGTPQRNISQPQERAKGIEPSPPAWKAGALPLSYARAGPPGTYATGTSGRGDLNSRLPAPKAGALPSCATSRTHPDLRGSPYYPAPGFAAERPGHRGLNAQATAASTPRHGG